MKKVILLICAGLLFMLPVVPVLAGGSGDAAPAPKAAADPGKPFQGEKIQFLLTYPQEKVVLYNMFDTYRAQSGVDLEILYMPLPESKAQINIMVASNTLSDVIDVDGIDTRAYAAMGILADITDRAQRDIPMDQYFEGPLEFATYNDKLYGLPLSPSNLCIFYNRAMFAAAGITAPPATWDEMRAALPKLTKAGVYGLAMPANKTSDAAFAFLSFMFQAGGTIETFGDATTVTALEFYKEMLDKKWMSVEMVNWSLEDGYNQFLGEKAAMLIDGCWRVKTLTSNAKFDWFTAPLPAGPAGKSVAMGGHNIAAGNGKKIDAAWDFMKFIHSESNMKLFCEAENYLPARKDVAAASTYFQSGPIKAFADSLEFTRPRGPLVKWPSYESVMVEAIQSVIIGSATPRAAAEKGAAEARQYLD